MSNPAADRNLLFGILALQLDFITRDALIAAMHAWVLQKSKPIGQILIEQDDLGQRLARASRTGSGRDATFDASSLPIAVTMPRGVMSREGLFSRRISSMP